MSQQRPILSTGEFETVPPPVAVEPEFRSVGNVPTGVSQETPSIEQELLARAAKADPFPPGTVIDGRYLVERRLGTGGMGSVYLVIDQTRQKSGDKDARLALKFMSPKLAQNEDARSRFMSEAQSRKLSHPHIVDTIEIHEWKARHLLYITMEYVPGQNLRQHLFDAKPRLPFELTTTLELMRQLLAALDFAHKSTIHRDIKPENLLVVIPEDGSRPILKLTDFGIARQFDDEHQHRTKGAIGTLSYMAPEQKAGAEIDARVDLYSVGVVLYELLTGRLPEGRFKSASQLDQRIPKTLDTIIDRALAQDPAERFANAGWMQAEIEKVLKSLSATMVPVTAPTNVVLEGGDFTTLIIDIEQRRAPQITLPGVPPIPDEILELEGREQSLGQTLELLKAETHPALKPHQAALADLERRLASLRSDLEHNTSDELAPELRHKIIELLKRDLHTEEAVFLDMAPELSTLVVFTFVDGVRDVLEAEQAVSLAKDGYQRAKAEKIAELEDERTKTLNQLQLARDCDLRSLVKVFFQERSLQTRFPAAAWSQFEHRVLIPRRYGLNSRELLGVAKAICGSSDGKEKSAAAGSNKTQPALAKAMSRRRWFKRRTEPSPANVFLGDETDSLDAATPNNAHENRASRQNAPLDDDREVFRLLTRLAQLHRFSEQATAMNRLKRVQLGLAGAWSFGFFCFALNDYYLRNHIDHFCALLFAYGGGSAMFGVIYLLVTRKYSRREWLDKEMADIASRIKASSAGSLREFQSSPRWESRDFVRSVCAKLATLELIRDEYIYWRFVEFAATLLSCIGLPCLVTGRHRAAWARLTMSTVAPLLGPFVATIVGLVEWLIHVCKLSTKQYYEEVLIGDREWF